MLNPDFVAAVAEIAGALTSNPSQVNGYISTLFGDFGERPHLPSRLPCVGLSEQRCARFLPALAAPMPIRAFAQPPSRSFGLGLCSEPHAPWPPAQATSTSLLSAGAAASRW